MHPIIATHMSMGTVKRLSYILNDGNDFGVGMTNPKSADICKTRRVKGLEIILIERELILYNMIHLKLTLLESNY